MSRWIPTEADRNAQGRIRVPGFDTAETSNTAFTATLNESLAAVGATSPPAEAPPATSARRSFSPIALAVGAGVVVLVLLALARFTAFPAPARPAPTASAAPATLAPSPPASPVAILPRAVVAYAAPDGAVLGAIPAPAAAVARYGEGWAQVAHEDGTVWVRAGDLADLAIMALPDLAPPPTATPAPRPAPIAPAAPGVAPLQAAPCDAANATFHVRSPVLGPKGEPYGSVDGISCVSLVEAEHNAQVLARQVLDAVTATALQQGR